MSFARRNITQYRSSRQRQISSDLPPNLSKLPVKHQHTMCHFDNLIKLISLDNDCMFHFIFDVIYGKPCFIHIKSY